MPNAQFAHGVASGDPRQSSVVIWTRVTPTWASKPGSGSGPDVTGDITTADANKETLLRLGKGCPVPPGTTSEKPYSVFMNIYAAFCRMHMKKFGTDGSALFRCSQ